MKIDFRVPKTKAAVPNKEKNETMKFTLTTYNIKECGYYRMGEKETPTLGGAVEIFSDLFGWIRRCHTLRDTCIHNAARRNIAPIFIYEMERMGNDYIVTTWNSRNAGPGVPVLGVDGATPPGKVRVESRKFSKNMIPGIPTYFFVAADKNLLVTLCPEQSYINGHAEFDYYIESFLGRHASFLDCDRIFESEDEGSSSAKHRRVVGLEGKEENFFPRFVSKPDIGAANKKFLRENASKIRKIVHSIDLSNKPDYEKKSFMASLMQLTGLRTEASVSGKFCMRYEIDLSLDSQSVTELIAQWDQRPATWDNVGFLLKGEQSPIWLDGGFKRTEINLSVNAPNGVFSAVSLLSAVEQIRSYVI